MAKAIISAEQLRSALHYAPETGVFTRASGVVICSKPSPAGYLRFYVGGYVRDYAHRWAVLYMTGDLPPQGTEVDHINGDPSDNRWSNLRIVSVSVNQQNQTRPHSKNSTGFLGVGRQKGGRFSAQIWIDGRGKRLGQFATAEEAHAAYVEAKRKMHVGNML